MTFGDILTTPTLIRASSVSHRNASSVIVLIGIMLIAANLRAPFTSIAPLLETVMRDLHLSSSAAGAISALPLIAFAAVSPLCAGFARRWGLNQSLLSALTIIAVGVVCRSLGTAVSLYLGTLLIGVGIAVGNVLLPVVVKTNFPARIAVITASYSLMMGIGSTLSSSLMVPLQTSDSALQGWTGALLFNLIFPLLALAVWLPYCLQQRKITRVAVNAPSAWGQIVRHPMAWQITLAMGLNSFTFYTFSGWLPKVLVGYGHSELQAGYLHGLLLFSTMLPGLLLLPFLNKTGKQPYIVMLSGSTSAVGIFGLTLAPSLAPVWIICFGLGNASTFIMVLSFIASRTTTSEQAAALSGMAQCLGYLFAATGPSLIGKLYSLFGHWHVALGLTGTVALIGMVFSVLSARDRKIE
uniref:MFS transporter n=1 Tax=Thaumasiovibrio occultus TaxID=1891184 RepID=UPI000B356881|nr:MFS transporter [Thaumasiovibrio occultus]